MPTARRTSQRLIAKRPISLALAAALAVAPMAPAASAPEEAPPSGNPARQITGYPALYGIAGAKERKGLPLADAATRSAAATRYCAAIDYAARTDSDALLVWRDGQLELANDFAPHTANARSWSASMAKTLTALALGIAIEEGVIASVDTPVSEVLTEWDEAAHRAITYRHLLEMTSGLEHPAPGSAGASALVGGEDAVGAGLALPVVNAPGSTFDYHTVNVTLLIEAIHRASGEPFARFVSTRLWQPLGAADALIAGDASGHATPSIYARARDWMRLGLLIKERGMWHGKRLVPTGWIDAMTRPSPRNANYGWLTWLGSPEGEGRSYGPYVAFQARHSAPFLARDMVYLDGFGGQRVYISREADTVIVRTGGMYVNWDDAALPNAILGSGTECAANTPTHNKYKSKSY
ncbi:serine hydrolase domain-containing protein [Novosphingobium mangrovi (ex Hu et al. 2023)]|uniref:Beta-lactamase family protein n=1 Tax=Novosphingobium mangrovi (ex Hu et al. 2023) TaxID=2930094 RepID=A0ABT0ABJ2_9SPHN|nr:serine hydrolase [Novosphingobium mangrovi (ex Hu et al. 2023)]MCJ1960536.1 beta-lactamase family protein [Novosphingobium mangrovi (ex Hu et al. 2023)]